MNTISTREFKTYRASDQVRFRPDELEKQVVQNFCIVDVDAIATSALERGNGLGSVTVKTFTDRHGYPTA